MWNNKQTITETDINSMWQTAIWRKKDDSEVCSVTDAIFFPLFNVWTEPILYTNCRTFRRGNARCEYGYWQDITVWCMSLFPTLTNKPRIMSLNWVSSRSLSNFKSFFPSMFSSASFDVTILTLIFPTRKKRRHDCVFDTIHSAWLIAIICIIADVQMCKC